ncbi:MAG: thioesterase family protein [Dehalococcoidia bacterium]|nr:thioesterase family protein [Dehalococcoidia bacterium]
MLPEAIFLPDGDRFLPTEGAASPWGPGLLHGGPPAGLLARAIERAADPELHPVRLTIDLFRPVPRQPLTCRVAHLRTGKRIAVIEAALIADGVEVARATGLLLRPSSIRLSPDVMPPPPRIEHHVGVPALPLVEALRIGAREDPGVPMLPGFHSTVEARRVSGGAGTGKGTAWIRIPVPFVAGEETSPLVRVAATADFGNGLGHIRPSETAGFINADITLYLHRLPAGEWICLETAASAQEHGLGLVESIIHDPEGPVGRVDQAIMVNQRHSG